MYKPFGLRKKPLYYSPPINYLAPTKLIKPFIKKDGTTVQGYFRRPKLRKGIGYQYY